MLFGSKIFENSRFVILFSSLPFQEGGALATLGEDCIRARGDARPTIFDGVPEDLVIEEELCHRIAEENHYSRPEEPISRTWYVVWIVHARHAVVGHPPFPPRVIGNLLLTHTYASVHQDRANETPGYETAS